MRVPEYSRMVSISPKILAVLPLCLLTVTTAAPLEAIAQDQMQSAEAPICRSLKSEWESARSRGLSAAGAMDRYGKDGAAAEQRFASLRERYDDARQSGNMTTARDLALQMDEAWTQTGEAARRVSSSASTALSAVKDACAIWQRGMANGCNDIPNRHCQSGISMLSDAASFGSTMATKYSGTWRKAEDHNFDDPNVLAACADGPTVVPFPARIVSVQGRAFVVRGMRTLPATEGMKLAAKDIVASEDGSLVTLYIMGSGELKITEKSKFEIPERFAEQSPSEPGLADQAGQEFKKILQGESFEIKTPTATCGVRG